MDLINMIILFHTSAMEFSEIFLGVKFRLILYSTDEMLEYHLFQK